MPERESHWTIWARHHLEQLEVGLFDLIDCGLPEPDDVVLRGPEDDEVVATRRGQDEDADYARAPSPRGRTAGPSDPTWREVARWDDAVATALVDLQRLVDLWAEATDRIAGARKLTGPVDEQGNICDAPTYDQLHLVATDSGRFLAELGPDAARRAVHTRLVWLQSARDFLADVWTHETDTEQLDHLNTAGAVLTAGLARLTAAHRRRGAPGGSTRCANPHGEHPHPTPPGQAICDDCAVRYRCLDPLRRGCRRAVESAAARRNATACQACRKAASRRGISLATVR